MGPSPPGPHPPMAIREGGRAVEGLDGQGPDL